MASGVADRSLVLLVQRPSSSSDWRQELKNGGL